MAYGVSSTCLCESNVQLDRRPAGSGDVLIKGYGASINDGTEGGRKETTKQHKTDDDYDKRQMRCRLPLAPGSMYAYTRAGRDVVQTPTRASKRQAKNTKDVGGCLDVHCIHRFGGCPIQNPGRLCDSGRTLAMFCRPGRGLPLWAIGYWPLTSPPPMIAYCPVIGVQPWRIGD